MDSFQRFDWTIEDESEARGRIDKFLVEQEDGHWSRSQVQKWIKDGQVTVNGETVKPNYILQPNDEIVLNVPPPKELSIRPEAMELDIYFEDRDVIVINKPRGLVVHPAPGHYEHTLVNGLLYHCKDLSGINGVLRPGIVHRIDKDTSGLIMAAKNDDAHLSLAAQLKAHSVSRTYIALVHGNLSHETGTVDAPIGRDPKDRKRMAVVSKNGKRAVTRFRLLKAFRDYSLVELNLETGRTHQIRVHMAYIGHPLAGDPKYGPRKTLPIEGQALHAAVLGFQHPRSGERMEFKAALPEDMRRLVSRLEENLEK